jgi:hypothetical protein
VAITVNIALLFMIYSDVPAVYHAMLSAPNIALESAMACRVFRAVKLGTINHDGTAKSTTLASTRPSRPKIPGSTNEYPLDSRSLKNPSQGPIVVEVMKTTDSKEFKESLKPQLDSKYPNNQSELIFDRV